MAEELVRHRDFDISHIQAVSVGRPSDITDTPGHLLVLVIVRNDRCAAAGC